MKNTTASILFISALLLQVASLNLRAEPAGNERGPGERVIYVFDSHEQLYSIMKHWDYLGVQLLHLDYHDDIRESLIDIENKQHYMLEYKTKADVDILKRYEKITCVVAGSVDEGNFLSYAAKEGRISALEWVHDNPGGRFTADPCTVLYRTDMTEEDFSAYTGDRTDNRLDYEETRYGKWDGLKPGWQLSLDWDFFASTHLPKDGIDRRTQEFMESKLTAIPDVTYLCYSPNYSHSSREQFRRFAQKLAEKFDARIIPGPPFLWKVGDPAQNRAQIFGNTPAR